MNGFNHQSGNYIQYRGAEIYYEVINKFSDHTLLFLHGGGHSITEFNPILTRLNKSYRIIGIDNRGHGKSTLGDEHLSYALLQEEIEFILTALNIKKFSIIGFSNGGTLAYRLAVFSSLSINKVITISAPWDTQYVKCLFEAFKALNYSNWSEMEPQYCKEYHKINPQPDHKKLFDALKGVALDEGESGRPNGFVKKILCPVLALRGENDPIVSLESLRSFQSSVEKASIVSVPKAEHNVIEQNPSFVVEYINQFLEN